MTLSSRRRCAVLRRVFSSEDAFSVVGILRLLGTEHSECETTLTGLGGNGAVSTPSLDEHPAEGRGEAGCCKLAFNFAV
eukprot:203017-Amorphochlora_amoeboformis.AAC.1